MIQFEVRFFIAFGNKYKLTYQLPKIPKNIVKENRFVKTSPVMNINGRELAKVVKAEVVMLLNFSQ